jgi:hypothetical protein
MLARIFILFIAVVSAQAQDTKWLKPVKFRYNVGDTCRIALQKGERLIGTYYSVSRDSAGTFSVVVNGKETDLASEFISNQRHHLAVPLKDEGTYQFRWERHNVFEVSDLTILQNYLVENGLDETSVSGESAFIIHEYVSDILLVQSGRKRTSISPIGEFPLEIIPEKNPYELKKGDPLTLVVKDRGVPVFGFYVMVRNRYDDRTTIQKIFTEKDGSFRTIISSPGPWMISYAVIDANQNVNTIGITRINLLFGY